MWCIHQTVRQTLSLAPVYRLKEWSFEGQSNLSKVRKLLDSGVRNWTHRNWIIKSTFIYLFFFFLFYFIFKLYIIVLVLPNIKMNPPQVYMCSPSWTLLPPSLRIPSLWVVPVQQPQASSIMHWTWTGNSFHIWYFTCFNAILPNHPTLSLCHRVQKTVLYICVFFAVSYTGSIEQSYGLCGRGRRWEDLGEWHWNM